MRHREHASKPKLQVTTTAVYRPRPSLLWRIKETFARSALAWMEHDASTMGAALAFYTVFSIAPILIIAIGVWGMILGNNTVGAELLPQMQGLLGDAGATAVQALISSASYMERSRMATVIGVFTLLLGASTVFVELQTSLDRIWGIPKRNRTRGIWRFLRARFLSLGLVFGVAFLLMVSLFTSAALAVVGAWLSRFLGVWHLSLMITYVCLSLVFSTVLFALVYKYIPQERLRWRDVWVGGLVTAVLFNIGKFAIGYYLGKSAFASVYGAAGSLLVLLLWAYYSAQIFLFGAEFTKSYTFILGTRANDDPADKDR